MEKVILVVHLMLAIALVVSVLLQRSEGGALGIGGGPTGLMSNRGAANLLTRTTGILAGCFFATSMGLAIMASQGGDKGSVLDLPATAGMEETVPVEKDELPGVPVSE